MPAIVGIGTSVPPLMVRQDQARDYAAQHFKDHLQQIRRLSVVFDHAEIDTRYFVTPPEWWHTKQHSLQERNDMYLRDATLLGQTAIECALLAAGLSPQDVDNLIVVSSTGLATPSLDARLMNTMHMRSEVRRMPMWGLGCAGGVAGLARAMEMARAYPESITVLMAVETSSLTFQFGDMSKKNFISTALFGDGAAAVVVAGDKRGGDGKRIAVIDCRSTTWP